MTTFLRHLIKEGGVSWDRNYFCELKTQFCHDASLKDRFCDCRVVEHRLRHLKLDRRLASTEFIGLSPHSDHHKLWLRRLKDMKEALGSFKATIVLAFHTCLSMASSDIIPQHAVGGPRVSYCAEHVPGIVYAVLWLSTFIKSIVALMWPEVPDVSNY